MHFSKYDGLGNDYLVIDPSNFSFEPTPDVVRAICDRHRGVGSDGILYGPLAGFSQSAGPDPDLRIFNPDGSEAAKSGNGLRIFSWYLFEHGLREGKDFYLLTKGGRVKASIVDPGAGLVRIDMGDPDFHAASVPVVVQGLEGSEVVDMAISFEGIGCRITCLSMGNPHCVVMGLGASEEIAKRLGPAIERSPLFPDRANVQFLEVRDHSTIRIAIWERGAGWTLASGSSSCAAAAAARRLGLVGDEVTVLMAGGSLDIRFSGGTVLMTGPVEKSFEGNFSDDLLARMGMGRQA